MLAEHDLKTGSKPTGRRKPTNVSLSADKLAAAKELGVNVSRACEDGLARAVRSAREAQFLEENRAAFDQYNRWVQENGLPAAAYRRGA